MVHRTGGRDSYVRKSVSNSSIPTNWQSSSFVFLYQNSAFSLSRTRPAGFEQFVLEMGDPATELVLPTPAAPDMGKLIALAAKRRIDILGPLPE